MAAPATDSAHEQIPRCGAAHPDDGSPCEGDPQAVRLVVGADEVLGCVHHAARLLASVDHAQVHPVGGPSGPNVAAAQEVAHQAAGMKPFFWMTGRTR